MKNIKLFSFLNKVFAVILYSFIILAILFLYVVIKSKKNNDVVSIMNHQIRIVTSESMEKGSKETNQYKIKSLPLKSMIIIEQVDNNHEYEWYQSLKVGDVLTFKYVYIKQETITHRIINIQEVDNGFIITLQGDNQDIESNTSSQTIDTRDINSPNYIIGKVVYKNVLLGKIIYILKQPIGIGCLIILPSFIIIILEIIKIINIINEKKKKETEEEINLLKKRIETLQKGGEQ